MHSVIGSYTKVVIDYFLEIKLVASGGHPYAL